MKRILFVNQDMIPYVEETELSSMSKILPQKIQEAGYEIRSFMPRWGNINERRGQLHEVIRLSGINIPVNDNDHPLIIKVASIPQTKMQVYFIDNEEFFSRKGQTTDANGTFYKDNGERAIFFVRGVIETLKKLRWYPDVIICQGWMASLLPVYVKTVYKEEPAVCNSKLICSIFDTGPEKHLERNFKKYLCYKDLTKEYLSKYKNTVDAMELAKMAIDHADGIVFASANTNKELKKYAKESGKKCKTATGEKIVAAYKDLIEKL